MQCIDIFTHFAPKCYLDFLTQYESFNAVFEKLFKNNPPLTVIEKKLEQMKALNITKSVIVPLPWMEDIPELLSNGDESRKAADLCNQEMARLQNKYPDQFFAVGVIPTSDKENMIASYLDAINKYGLSGIVIFVGPHVKPLDHPDYLALFEIANQYDKPIWIHPCRNSNIPDYIGEQESKYMIWQALGWVFDSSVAMIRLAMTNIFARLNNLRIITHHNGAMIPSFLVRMQYSVDFFNKVAGKEHPDMPAGPIADHLKHFYCDTACHGYNPLLIEQSIQFFGEDKILFGTDAPMDTEYGRSCIKNAQDSVSAIRYPEETKEKILFKNAINLLG